VRKVEDQPVHTSNIATQRRPTLGGGQCVLQRHVRAACADAVRPQCPAE
jgi:hypothetical protein